MRKGIRFRLEAVIAAALLCAGAATLAAQTAPPVKMGLWESTINTTMGGFQLPPEVAEKLKQMGRPVPGSTPTTVESQACYTKEQWEKDIAKAQDRKDIDCSTQNLTRDSHKMTFDQTCRTAHGTSTGHMEMFFDDDEHVHGAGHFTATETSGSQAGHPITIDFAIKSHYLKSDCGDVLPGQPKILK